MGMNFDVNQDYFHWLCEAVGIEQEDKAYWLLAKDLHRMPFYSLVPHDENRAMDGVMLRDEYLDEINCPKYVRIDLEDCTMLEMLVALAKRMDYETSNPRTEVNNTAGWFWEMMNNLGLSGFDDAHYVSQNGLLDVDDILKRLVERTYSRDGTGGLFPLKWASGDQREAEIWFQMNAYLAERDAV